MLPGGFDFFVGPGQLLRELRGIGLFDRIAGVAVWMAFFEIGFPAFRDLRHGRTKGQVEDTIVARQFLTVWQTTTRVRLEWGRRRIMGRIWVIPRARIKIPCWV